MNLEQLDPNIRAVIEAGFDWVQPNFFRILNWDNQLVPFIANKPQRYLKQQSAGHKFTYILKARKMGVSSNIFCEDIWACASQKNQHAICLTHTDEAAIKLFEEKVKPLIKNCKFPLRARPKVGKIEFPETNSTYYMGTAGSRTFGRGDDITRYHLSEYAHWKKPDVITGVEEACLEGAIGRIETTANGVNFAKKDWERAHLCQSRYKDIFIPWFVDDRYQIPGAFLEDLTQEEKDLIEAFDLTQPQLAWRRAKIKDMSQPELFPQEYPATPEEAFISSGKMVFNWIALARQEKHCTDPKVFGYLRDEKSTISVLPGNPENVKIWEFPEVGHEYIIGADIAEGIEDGAYSAGFVLDIGLGTQVAEWHGHIAPDLFADELIKLAMFYNGSLLVPESWPGPGEVTQSQIEALGYRHYYRNPNKNTNARGWETNTRSRQDALLQFAGAVRDMRIILKSKELISEMRSFVYDAKQHMGPSLGCFSDRLIAAAISWRVGMDYADRVTYDQVKIRDHMAGRMASAVTVPRFKNPFGRRQTDN